MARERWSRGLNRAPRVAGWLLPRGVLRKCDLWQSKAVSTGESRALAMSATPNRCHGPVFLSRYGLPGLTDCHNSRFLSRRSPEGPLGYLPRLPWLALPQLGTTTGRWAWGRIAQVNAFAASRGLRRERGGGDNERASIRAVVASDVTYALSDNVWRQGPSSAIEPWRQTPEVSAFRVSHPSMILRLTSCLTEMDPAMATNS